MSPAQKKVIAREFLILLVVIVMCSIAVSLCFLYEYRLDRNHIIAHAIFLEKDSICEAKVDLALGDYQKRLIPVISQNMHRGYLSKKQFILEYYPQISQEVYDYIASKKWTEKTSEQFTNAYFSMTPQIIGAKQWCLDANLYEEKARKAWIEKSRFNTYGTLLLICSIIIGITYPARFLFLATKWAIATIKSE